MLTHALSFRLFAYNTHVPKEHFSTSPNKHLTQGVRCARCSSLSLCICVAKGKMPPRSILTTSQQLEDGLELYRRCRNACIKNFSGDHLSALQNFCAQRKLLVEDRRRIVSLAQAVHDPSRPNTPIVCVSPGCSGVLSLFATNDSPITASAPNAAPAGAIIAASASFPLIDGLIAQHDADITALVAQLHRVIEQYQVDCKRLRSMAFGLRESGGDEDPSTAYSADVLSAAMCTMAEVSSNLFVWMSRALVDLRRRLPDPNSDGADAAIFGLAWWDAASQPIDGKKAWEAASKAMLNDVALVLLATNKDL